MMALIAFAVLFAVADTPQSLSPTSDCSASNVSNGCAAKRSFGTPSTPTTLDIQTYFWKAGPRVIVISNERAGETSISGNAVMTLAPNGVERRGPFVETDTPDGRRITEITLRQAAVEDFSTATTLSLRTDGGMATSYIIGPKVAVTMLTSCMRKLLQPWGIDPAKRRPVLPPGAPGFVDIAPFFSIDSYPRQAIVEGAAGRAVVLLDIGVSGVVSNCRILESSGNASLDSGTCAAANKIVYPRFGDAKGKPTASWTIVAVRWILPEGAATPVGDQPVLPKFGYFTPKQP